VLQFTSPFGFDVGSPGLAVSFLESSCRSKFANRSGKGSSCWTRYSSRSSSAIAARIMARSSLCLGVVRRTGHIPPTAPPTKLLFVIRHQTCRIQRKRQPSRQVFLAALPIQKFLVELLLSLSIEPWWRVRLFRSGTRNRSAGHFRRMLRRDFGRRGGFGLPLSNLRVRSVLLNQLLLRCVGHAT
jgi:hypothetical protein